jgi:hypothetical protein
MRTPKLTYSNVMATLALFVALGGASYAATQLPKNSVGAKQLKTDAVTTLKIMNGAVTGEKLDVSTIGTVASARRAATAGHADTATSAATAASAATAEIASAIGPSEPRHVVAAEGEVGFNSGWGNFSPSTPASFYKDPEGIVHLEGEVKRTGGSNDIIFTLPPGFAPLQAQGFVVQATGAATTVSVRANGDVSFGLGPTGQIPLNGLSWRVG